MDGIHDLGGKEGFGPVLIEADEPVFHAAWEAKLFPILRAAAAGGASSNVDQFRHAIERIDPVAYLTHGYYGRWLGGIENLLVEGGVLTRAEIDTRVVRRGGDLSSVASRPSATPLRVGPPSQDGPAQRADVNPPRFGIGQRVITLRHGHLGHTRLPAYARGRRGHVVALCGTWVYPDTNAHGLGENPQHLYTVAFDSAELWGADAEPHTNVRIDLFEPYLLRAERAAEGSFPRAERAAEGSSEVTNE